MEKFIEVKPGIEIRPEYIVKKEVLTMEAGVFYHIKVLGDKEYCVEKEVFDKIQ